MASCSRGEINGCTCGMLDTIRKQRETEYVIFFLKGLGDQFNILRTQILRMEPFPSIGKEFSIVLQQERQIGGSLLGESPNVLMANAGGVQGTNNVCTTTKVVRNLTTTLSMAFHLVLDHYITQSDTRNSM